MPKSLIPVLGRPFAELQLEWLAEQGVESVIYCIGYRGEMVRDALGLGDGLGLRIAYVDEGETLRGTGGALRLALDQGLLPDAFFVLYGDSYLDLNLSEVERIWGISKASALMTVLHNRGRWDRSNARLVGGHVIFDKRDGGADAQAMDWIDYGLSVMRSDVIAELIPKDARADLADAMQELSRRGQLAGFEVTERFYEVGSPEGLRDLEKHLRQRNSGANDAHAARSAKQ